MYRGSSFLLEHDYRFQIGLIDIIKKYSFLYGISLKDFSNNIDKIIALDLEIKHYYEKDNKKYIKNGKEMSIKVSETLSSKIIMGALGCLPAYDRFFKAGLSQLNIKASYSVTGFQKLVNYFNEHSIDFDQVRKDIKTTGSNIKYPDMKLIDMAIFQLGMDLRYKKVLKIDSKSLAICNDGSYRVHLGINENPVVPVPSAFILGILGLGVAGKKLRRLRTA